MGAHQDQVRGFAEYNRAFNLSLFGLVARLDEEQRRRDMGAFFGSIHGTLNHLLLADRIWLGRFDTAMPGLPSLAGASTVRGFSSLSQEVCADFELLFRERQATDRVIAAFAEDMSDARLAGTMRYANSKGSVREHPVWVAVAHMFNHQAHHRGQVTTLLSQLGHDPGVTDFVAYVT